MTNQIIALISGPRRNAGTGSAGQTRASVERNVKLKNKKKSSTHREIHKAKATISENRLILKRKRWTKVARSVYDAANLVAIIRTSSPRNRP